MTVPLMITISNAKMEELNKTIERLSERCAENMRKRGELIVRNIKLVGENERLRIELHEVSKQLTVYGLNLSHYSEGIDKLLVLRN